MTGQLTGVINIKQEFNLIPQGMVARETACQNEGFQNRLNKYLHPKVADFEC